MKKEEMKENSEEIYIIRTIFDCAECSAPLEKIWWTIEDKSAKVCWDCTPQGKKSAKVAAGLAAILANEQLRKRVKKSGSRVGKLKMTVVGKRTRKHLKNLGENKK